jgi:hypothetical protein
MERNGLIGLERSTKKVSQSYSRIEKITLGDSFIFS